MSNTLQPAAIGSAQQPHRQRMLFAAARRLAVRTATLLGTTALALVSLVCGASPAEAMIYHTNEVHFSYGDMGSGNSILESSYDLAAWSVPKDQDPKRRFETGQRSFTGSSGNFSFIAGRKANGAAADFWNRTIRADQSTFNHGAGQLNFAMTGTLRIKFSDWRGLTKTYVFPNIALAQGHSGSSNNWWFGGNFCTNVGGDTVSCSSDLSNPDNIRLFFRRGGNGVNDVNVWLAP